MIPESSPKVVATSISLSTYVHHYLKTIIVAAYQQAINALNILKPSMDYELVVRSAQKLDHLPNFETTAHFIIGSTECHCKLGTEILWTGKN